MVFPLIFHDFGKIFRKIFFPYSPRMFFFQKYILCWVFLDRFRSQKPPKRIMVGKFNGGFSGHVTSKKLFFFRFMLRMSNPTSVPNFIEFGDHSAQTRSLFYNFHLMLFVNSLVPNQLCYRQNFIIKKIYLLFDAFRTHTCDFAKSMTKSLFQISTFF